MDFSHIPVILFLAFGLGLLHSLDADHIMAVSNLSSGQPGIRRSIRFCLRWAIGHGLVLIGVGLVVFILGLSIPSELSFYAELSVAIVLVGLGLYVVYEIIKQRSHIHFHQHDDLPVHAHWHSHKKQASHQHSHTAVFVGMLHGLAGSAPLLALIPLAMTQKPIYGFIYLCVFSLGVLFAMLLFGGLLGYFSKRILQYSDKVFKWVRLSLGFGAVAVGGVILTGALR